jgi:hypothetical protein
VHYGPTGALREAKIARTKAQSLASCEGGPARRAHWHTSC